MPPLDSVAFEDCYRRVFPLVLAKCRRMLRGHVDATDVAQEVFMRLWKNRELIEDPLALTGWLYRASTRLVIDRARQRTLSDESLAHLQSLTGSVDDTSVERFASRRQLHSITTDFPAKELEVAILSRFDNLTHREIADVMGIGERTVRRLLERFDERVRVLRENAP
jgi:RNA polymerase sigma-70 factor, ECF subfamily